MALEADAEKLKTLKEAIGERKKPFSMGDALVETNPNYSYSYAAFSENCQRCVVAYELRRRGYDVEALPTYDTDKWNQVAYINPQSGVFEGRWKGAFRDAKSVNVGARTGSGVLSNIEKEMKAYGSGARGVIQIFYKSGGGHVFNVENVNGKVRYIEAQTGKIKNINETMSLIKPTEVALVRTDNLKISSRAQHF